jgi:hypothetical protein
VKRKAVSSNHRVSMTHMSSSAECETHVILLLGVFCKVSRWHEGLQNEPSEGTECRGKWDNVRSQSAATP